MSLLYLLVDLGAIAVPLLASFHPKIRLDRQWKALWLAILLSAVPFIIWDSYFTKIGVWGFTPQYLTGIGLFGLPIEEVLFFICIPYACMFTYYCFRLWKGPELYLRAENAVTWIFLILCIVLGLLGTGRYYTASTATALGAFLVYLKWQYKPKWLGLFYYSHQFLLLPFLIVNGILTGTGPEKPVVWYNNAENLGVRMLTIPVEDIFYGMLLLLLNALLFEYFLQKAEKTKRASEGRAVGEGNKLGRKPGRSVQ
ncbi:lycopene cyclase domain-containing protein [Dyadobacter sp. CY261]|uniref:lycopene cyclase domain-containing protein n=1 Tax=Dyadobacter sp. CY261 TaxID=2907203 RepID=UPI001F2EB0B2|nr:lycopene cyclase domain-containing protein [Dyadobacter sp. CY261]MCF0073832.1 lycopene cyclase domain-containing protein [Dyadobacter sp. CY261]